MNKVAFKNCLYILCSGIAFALSPLSNAHADQTLRMSDPAPLGKSFYDDVYDTKTPKPVLSGDDILSRSRDYKRSTPVSERINILESEYSQLVQSAQGFSDILADLNKSAITEAAQYYAATATINTQLQSGTTPGNPRLVKHLSLARQSLEKISTNATALNDLAIRVSDSASAMNVLLESVRATFALSGAVEEDHARLAILEDSVQALGVLVDRLLNNISDDITRTASYIASEQNNLRVLSLAVSSGSVFGGSIANRAIPKASFQTASIDNSSAVADPVSNPQIQANQTGAVDTIAIPKNRILAKIRFDRPNVKYEQPLYLAINDALKRDPNAKFDVIAIHPANGNASAIAIETTRARRNAEKVLRSLADMGLPSDRAVLSQAPSEQADTSEVHLYLR